MMKKASVQQQIYGIWQIVLKMNVLAINKISNNLKMKRFKMPNAAYSNRYKALPLVGTSNSNTLNSRVLHW